MRMEHVIILYALDFYDDRVIIHAVIKEKVLSSKIKKKGLHFSHFIFQGYFVNSKNKY